MIIRTIPRVCSKLLLSRFEWKKKTGKTGGGPQFLIGCTQEGGGSFRCVLCATGGGGVGVSKNQEKMRM